MKRRNFFQLFVAGIFLSLPASGFADTALVAVATGAQQKGKASNTDGLLAFGGGLLQEFRPKSSPLAGYELGLFYLQRKPGKQDVYSETSNWYVATLLYRRHMGAFSAGLGAYVARGFGNVTTQTGGVKTVAPLSQTLKDTDYGPQVALGFRFYRRIWMEGRYSIGLPNLSKAAGSEIRFREADFLLGLKF